MRLKFAGILIALFVLCGGTVLFAQVNAPESSAKLSRAEALSLTRTLGTMEATAQAQVGSFLSLEQLFQPAQFKKLKDQVTLTDSCSGTVKDYKISVVVSADGKHFRVSLKSTEHCNGSFFVDESFIIYEGNAIGCDEKEKSK
jgi:hypothetical protein